MIPLLGLLAAFTTIFLLRFRNMDFSLTLFAASLIVGLTSEKPARILFDVLVGTAMEETTAVLVAAVGLITILGFIMEETGMMLELVENLRIILPSRVLLALIPALFGLLTMPGGALMSAPFNEAEANRLGLKPEHKTYINIWFRHVWYWASPISSTVILAVSLSDIGLRRFITTNIPVFIVTVGIGLYVSSLFVEGVKNEGHEKNYSKALRGLSPILVAVVLSLAGVPVWIALILGISLVFVVERTEISEVPRMLWKGIRWEALLSIFAMLYFRNVVVESGSVETLFEQVMNSGIPLLAILVLIPLAVGVISGTPTMGIGIVFPLLLPLFPDKNVHVVSILLAGIVSTYIASPIHLCLILTNSYYHSDLNRVYRYLIPSVAVLFFAALSYHLLFSGLI